MSVLLDPVGCGRILGAFFSEGDPVAELAALRLGDARVRNGAERHLRLSA